MVHISMGKNYSIQMSQKFHKLSSDHVPTLKGKYSPASWTVKEESEISIGH